MVWDKLIGGEARAIALCGSRGWGAEEEAQPVIIIKGGAAFAATEAIAGRAVVAQQVEGHATHQGQVFRRVVLAGPAGIFPELDVQDPVLLIFDPPMAADDGGKPVALRQRAPNAATSCARSRNGIGSPPSCAVTGASKTNSTGSWTCNSARTPAAPGRTIPPKTWP